jgi:hypothetical protein
MSRWTIEKSGTGIEKSGTGIEKSGTGIEKSGTGIEKSGTGIEKSGTGIRKGFLVCSLAALAFTTHVNAAEIRPEGYMQIAVDQGQVSVMWNIDGNTFIGKGSQNGSLIQVSLFEISINSNSPGVEIAGGGTGIEIAGGGTGIEIAGGGTGIEIAGGGTGIEIAGGGTGIEIAGGGTGIEIAGGGTGIEIAGGGTGIEIAGGGTGIESVYITLPTGTGLELEIEMGCNSATVSVLDSKDFSEVVSFNNIKVLGDTGLCQVATIDTRQSFEKKSYRETTS